jgi:site-specific DNA-methyltransferase (adenine-specific)
MTSSLAQSDAVAINNRIMQGDATVTLRGIASDTVDLVLTDPPYLVGYRDRSGRTIRNDTNAAAVLPAYRELHRVLKADRYCLTFAGWNHIADFSAAWVEAGFRVVGQIVWTKRYASSVGHTAAHHESAWLLAKGWPERPAKPIRNVQPWTYSGNRVHPTEKAVAILRPMIESFSKPGDLILDPFSGSGSTAVAAALSGRRYLGIELEERYCETARRRLQGVERFARGDAA